MGIKTKRGQCPIRFWSVTLKDFVGLQPLNPFNFLNYRSQVRRENPLNLSILLSGGKETNKDSPSNGV